MISTVHIGDGEMVVYGVFRENNGHELVGLYISRADAEAFRDTIIYLYKDNSAAVVEPIDVKQPDIGPEMGGRI